VQRLLLPVLQAQQPALLLLLQALPVLLHQHLLHLHHLLRLLFLLQVQQHLQLLQQQAHQVLLLLM
jgi:hypothetical protein